MLKKSLIGLNVATFYNDQYATEDQWFIGVVVERREDFYLGKVFYKVEFTDGYKYQTLFDEKEIMGMVVLYNKLLGSQNATAYPIPSGNTSPVYPKL